MLQVGDEITRHDGRRFKLLGVRGGQWIATALDCFAPPLTLSARELATGFDVDDPTPPDMSEAEILRRADERATLEANHAYARTKAADEPQGGPAGPPPGSPEAIFAALAEEDADGG
jgi:hypothetical protein